MTDEHIGVTPHGTQTHPIITPARLQKSAVVYIRSATRHNADALAAQRQQVQLAELLGWRPEQIVVIDSDIGCSAVSGDRFGWHRLLHLIRSDSIGAVLITEFSRLTRSFSDFRGFCDLARAFDVLLVVGGRAVDLNEFPGGE